MRSLLSPALLALALAFAACGAESDVDIEEVAIPSVPDAQSRFVAFFDGNQEYLFNCQSTPEHREEIEQACDTALDTVKLDGAASN